MCYNGVNIGSNAIYFCSSCSLSLPPINHVSVRTCMENGTWDGSIPKCTCMIMNEFSIRSCIRINFIVYMYHVLQVVMQVNHLPSKYHLEFQLELWV